MKTLGSALYAVYTACVVVYALIRRATRNEEAEMRAWPKMHGKSVRRRSQRNVIILSTMKNTCLFTCILK